MATSYNVYEADGVTTAFMVTFEQADFTAIQVYLDDVLVTTGYSYNTVTNQIVFLTPPAAGVIVRLQRYTSTDLLNKFGQGAAYTGPNLDENFEQVVFKSEESNDTVERVSKLALRVPAIEGSVAELPPAADRAGMILGFAADSGSPTVVLPASGSASEIMLLLAGYSGYKYLGTCPDMATLRTLHFESVGQQVFLREHTAGREVGGGFYYCHAMNNTEGAVDFNGWQIINNYGQVIRKRDQDVMSVEHFGAFDDWNSTTQTGADHTTAIRNAVACAKAFGYRNVYAPGTYRVTGEINLGGVGYDGSAGVVVYGDNWENSGFVFDPATPTSVMFANRGGSGVVSRKGLMNLTLRTTTAKLGQGVLCLLDSCCFTLLHRLYIYGGAIGVHYLNSAPGRFTEFNILQDSRIQRCGENIRFEVNGGDNSFHANHIMNVQLQVRTTATDPVAGAGTAIDVRGVTAPAYLYNTHWLINFFGGAGAKALRLTNCNTDNMWGNLTHEGALICETTDANSYFEFKGNFSGIGTLTFNVNTVTSVRAANFVFNNLLDSYPAFTNAALSSFTPRLYNPEMADTTDNGVTASIWRVRSGAGDGFALNTFNGAPGWRFTTTDVNKRIQDAVPRHTFSNDGNSYTMNATTIFLNPSNSSYGLQLTSTGTAALAPRTDNLINCGTTAFRYIQFAAVNSTIATSDARHKTSPRDATQEELDAFYEIAQLPSVWQWLDKVATEGEDARLHAGPTVQAAIAIMEAHGLDWSKYAAFIYEPSQVVPAYHDENTGEYFPERVVGDVYAFRKEELLLWITRATIERQKSIEARLAALEGK